MNYLKIAAGIAGAVLVLFLAIRAFRPADIHEITTTIAVEDKTKIETIKKEVESIRKAKEEAERKLSSAIEENRDLKERETIERYFDPEGHLTSEKITKDTEDKTKTTTKTEAEEKTKKETEAAEKAKEEAAKIDTETKIAGKKKDKETTYSGIGLMIGGGFYSRINPDRFELIDFNYKNYILAAGIEIFDGLILDAFFLKDVAGSDKVGLMFLIKIL